MMFAGMNKKILEVNPGHPLIKELLDKVKETKA
jgi:HSP90 family molecular chaperone